MVVDDRTNPNGKNKMLWWCGRGGVSAATASTLARCVDYLENYHTHVPDHGDITRPVDGARPDKDALLAAVLGAPPITHPSQYFAAAVEECNEHLRKRKLREKRQLARVDNRGAGPAPRPGKASGKRGRAADRNDGAKASGASKRFSGGRRHQQPQRAAPALAAKPPAAPAFATKPPVVPVFATKPPGVPAFATKPPVLSERSRKEGSAASAEPWLSFEEAQDYARDLGLISQAEWNEWSDNGLRPVNIPSEPQHHYKKAGWQSWDVWLDTHIHTATTYLPFDEALMFARTLKLSGQDDYMAWCKSGKRPENIPVSPEQRYARSTYSPLCTCATLINIFPTSRKPRARASLHRGSGAVRSSSCALARRPSRSGHTG